MPYSTLVEAGGVHVVPHFTYHKRKSTASRRSLLESSSESATPTPIPLA
jgi:hypothetical protein